MSRHVIAAIAAIAAIASLAPAPTRASDPAEAAEPESPWRLGLAVGYGRRSNPLALSDNIPIIVDVDIAWFGERWFFDNGDLGVTMLDRDPVTLNLIGRLNSDRFFFTKTDSEIVTVFQDGVAITQQVEVPDRDYAVEVGFELLADGDWGHLQAAVHRDVSSRHDGYELYLNYGRGFRSSRWLLEPSFGVSWKSRKLNDYYWGVRQDEANLVFPAYRAGAGLNGHARFLVSYQLNVHWAFVAVAEYERMNSEASASPIVEDRDVVGIFAGLRYGF